MAAIASAHSVAQQHFDRIKDDIKGIRREHPRKKRQARPLVADDLKAILAGFGNGARAARDRLLFALGFAGALRRTELVGLDWQERSAGIGYIVSDDRGLVITLLNTKGGKGEPEEVIMRWLHGQPWRTCGRASRSFAASPREARSAAIGSRIEAWR
jgi:integrase